MVAVQVGHQTDAEEGGDTESRPNVTGAEPVVLQKRPACPLQVVEMGSSQKEEAVPGVAGCEERVCFHVSETQVFGLATLCFGDSSIENHLEPLSARLEAGVRQELALVPKS